MGVNALIHLTALFSGVCFSIDAARIDAVDGSHIGIRSVRECVEGMCGGG